MQSLHIWAKTENWKLMTQNYKIYYIIFASNRSKTAQNSPNLRICFIKRAHRMTLLKELWPE